MISWDDAITMANKFCQDSTSDGTTFQKMLLNVGYKEVLAALDRQVVEQQAQSVLVIAQRGYQVPPDCNMPKGIVLIDGVNRYPIEEEPSDTAWEEIRSGAQTGRPTKFHFRPRFGVGGGVFELNPVPNVAWTVELTYDATERDLSKARVFAGTVSLTNGSAVVTGTGTAFTADMVGRYFRATQDGAQRVPYRVKTYTSATSITLENVYQGPTQASNTYEIFEMFALPEDCHMLPIDYCAWQWFSTKGSQTRAGEHKTAYKKGMEEAKSRHSMVVNDNIIRFNGSFGSDAEYPNYFPTSVT